MSGPRTNRGRKRQGWRGEAAVRAFYEAEGFQVFDLSPNLEGADLLVVDKFTKRVILVVEVKTTPWRLLPSPIRRAVARAATAYRNLGLAHVVWLPDGFRGQWEVRQAGIDSDGNASTIDGPRQTAHPFAVGSKPRRSGEAPTGGKDAAVARSPEGGEE